MKVCRLRKGVGISVKAEKLQLVCELLIQQMNHWALFHVVLAVMGVTAVYTGTHSPNAVLWALCGILPVIFFFVRDKVNRFLPFFLIHLLAAGTVLIIPVGNGVERAICVVGAMVYAFTSFSRRLRENGRYTQPFSPAAGLALAIPAVLFQHYHGMPEWDSLHVLVLVICLAVYQVTVYMRRYLEFVSVNAANAGYLPAADMFRSGMSIVAAYTLLVSIILFFFTDVGRIDGIRDFIWRMLSGAVRFLLSFFSEEAAELQTDYAVPLPGKGYDTPVLLLVLLRIMSILITTAVLGLTLLFAAKILIELVRFVRRRFGMNFGTNNRFADAERDTDIREKCEPAGPQRADRPGKAFAFLNPAERVRRMYRKRVRSSAGELTEAFGMSNASLLGRLTARECGRVLDAEEMAEVYELVRYSGREATSGTVRRMREACRKKRMQ